MYELCSTCLSKHRNLVLLSSIEDISSLTETIPFVGSPVLVCWECKSRLQKMQAFKAQAIKAQELLKRCMENKKPLKALQSLSSLSISGTKTGYDENFEFCMKQETVEYEEEYLDDFESDVKYDTQVIEPKAEKIDTDNQESKYLCVMVEPLLESGDRDGTDSDVWPLPQDANKKVETNKIVKKESDVKKEPKVIGKNPEEKFTLKKMSLKELYRLRDEDRKNAKYLSYPFKCRSCITGFVLEEKYKAHLEINHSADIGPHACDICLSRHARADQLARHRETHFYIYHCLECPFTSHKQKSMLAHQSEHKVEKLTCAICGFSTSTEGRLRYHRIKTHKKPPTCQTCGKKFTTGVSLKKHTQQMHGRPRKLEKCAVCGGMYNFLRIHMRTHDPPATDAFCVECGVNFKNKNTLRQHLSVHSKHVQQNDPRKGYACEECDYRTMNKGSLERHKVAQHTKQYPLKCHICHKGFLRRDKLKYHVLERHEGGERPRKNMCSYCGKAFKTKGVLTNHIRTHTGERPFKCAHCPWSFVQRAALRTHERAKHPGADTGNTGKSGGAGGSGSPKSSNPITPALPSNE